MPVIDIHSTILMYGDDEVATSNPQRRFTDWSRHVCGVSVDQPSIREYLVPPGQLWSIFSGSRTTFIDGTTTLDLGLLTGSTSEYRMTYNSGTAPGFRIARSYDPTSTVHTMIVNNNSTLEMSIPSGNFNAVVGDIVFLPDTTTGDSPSPFNVQNVGFWVVIGVPLTSKLVMQRPAGQDFSAVTETVTPSSIDQVQIFSSSGVQIGDFMEVSAGFANPTQRTFVVSQVTATWVEFTSSLPLPLETGILPTATGLVFYTDAKRFLRVEVDQEAVVRLNGDTGNTNRLSPMSPGDQNQVAHYEKSWGPVWSLQVLNRSAINNMVVTIISAE